MFVEASEREKKNDGGEGEIKREIHVEKFFGCFLFLLSLWSVHNDFSEYYTFI